MKAIELVVEGTDLVHQRHNLAGVRRPDPVWIKREIGPTIQVYEDGGLPDLHLLRKKLRLIRDSYCTYIAPWAPPLHSFMPVYRPGWGHAPIQEEFETGEVKIEWKPAK